MDQDVRGDFYHAWDAFANPSGKHYFYFYERIPYKCGVEYSGYYFWDIASYFSFCDNLAIFGDDLVSLFLNINDACWKKFYWRIGIRAQKASAPSVYTGSYIHVSYVSPPPYQRWNDFGDNIIWVLNNLMNKYKII